MGRQIVTLKSIRKIEAFHNRKKIGKLKGVCITRKKMRWRINKGAKS